MTASNDSLLDMPGPSHALANLVALEKSGLILSGLCP